MRDSEAPRIGPDPRARPASQRVRALLALLLATTTACAGPVVPQPPPRAEVQPYLVGTPDVLSVLILPEPRIERSVVVRPDGMVSLDIIGDVQAAGRTPQEIGADVRDRIAPYRAEAHVTVAVTAAASTTVTILGEVREPSTLVLSRQTRLSEAIGLAGGPTSFALKDAIRLVRSRSEATVVHSIDFDAIEMGNLAGNMYLEDGDIIVVPPTMLARIGYAMAALLFPFQPLIGTAGAASGLIITTTGGRR